MLIAVIALLLAGGSALFLRAEHAPAPAPAPEMPAPVEAAPDPAEVPPLEALPPPSAEPGPGPAEAVEEPASGDAEKAEIAPSLSVTVRGVPQSPRGTLNRRMKSAATKQLRKIAKNKGFSKVENIRVGSVKCRGSKGSGQCFAKATGSALP